MHFETGSSNGFHAHTGGSYWIVSLCLDLVHNIVSLWFHTIPILYNPECLFAHVLFFLFAHVLFPSDLVFPLVLSCHTYHQQWSRWKLLLRMKAAWPNDQECLALSPTLIDSWSCPGLSPVQLLWSNVSKQLACIPLTRMLTKINVHFI